MRPPSILCAAFVVVAAFAAILIASTIAIKTVFFSASSFEIEIARNVPFVQRYDARFPHPSTSTLANDVPTALIDLRALKAENKEIRFSLAIRQPRLSSRTVAFVDCLRIRPQNSSDAFDLTSRYSEHLRGTWWCERTTHFAGFAPAGDVVDVLRITLDPPLPRASVSLKLTPPEGSWGAAKRTLTVLAAAWAVVMGAAVTIASTTLYACAASIIAARYPVNKTAPRAGTAVAL